MAKYIEAKESTHRIASFTGPIAASIYTTSCMIHPCIAEINEIIHPQNEWTQHLEHRTPTTTKQTRQNRAIVSPSNVTLPGAVMRIASCPHTILGCGQRATAQGFGMRLYEAEASMNGTGYKDEFKKRRDAPVVCITGRCEWWTEDAGKLSAPYLGERPVSASVKYMARELKEIGLTHP